MDLPFVTVDVFTTVRYRGNPLAVVTIPADGPQPSQEQKQAIAREFNLSETVFVHHVNPDSPGCDVTSRVIDIFTTDAELPFAGHPVIGTAFSLIPEGVDTVVTKAGPVAIIHPRIGHVQASIPHNARCHRRTLADLTAPAPGQLSPHPEILRRELQSPLFSIVNGMTFALINMPDLEHLAQVQTSVVSLPVELLDDGWQNGLLCKYYYLLLRERDDDGVTVLSIRTRMMEATMEDPATGSAACALSCFLSLQHFAQLDQTLRFKIDQGVEMGRESNIEVEVAVKDSQIDTVKLSGTAEPVMRGYVRA
ncbi:hypothetical protein FZEAL_7452 [Fusarium zealandicum]|uniref:Phenazine biosynthesis protein n=1 Tax=Fusarium zealandicum TaxID=1053134 RepID=A0A8H4UFP0_9HYPO|nr:hypothetical protein FZEAL_7452 [Fusarium zealandicum]